jgi:glycosyltransferase involved in cell wall biosynthesis
VRVLWLARGLGLSGAARLLLTAAQHVDRERFDVEVAYVVPGEDALAADLEKAGATVHCLTSRPGRRGLDPLWPVRLRSLVERRGYRLVHTHAPWPAITARLLLRGALTVPLVHSEYDVRGHRSLVTRLADTATQGRNRAVFAGSRAVAQSLRPPRGADPRSWLTLVRLSPGPAGAPADDGTRAAARRALGVPAGAVAVGAVGSLTARKELGVLIDAFALLRRSHADTVLVLVGAGPREKRLLQYACARGVKDSVVFAGARPDVAALLPALDVFALSSRREAVPVALMEAMAAGLPSAVTGVDAVPELVDPGVEALVVRPGDHEAMAIALGRLAGGPALRARMAAAARERARRFDPAAAQRAVEAVYERVLGEFQAEAAGKTAPAGEATTEGVTAEGAEPGAGQGVTEAEQAADGGPAENGPEAVREVAAAAEEEGAGERCADARPDAADTYP